MLFWANVICKRLFLMWGSPVATVICPVITVLLLFLETHLAWLRSGLPCAAHCPCEGEGCSWFEGLHSKWMWLAGDRGIQLILQGKWDAGQTLLCLPRYCCVHLSPLGGAMRRFLLFIYLEDWWESWKWAALETWPRALIFSGLILHMGKSVVKQPPHLLGSCLGFHCWNDSS